MMKIRIFETFTTLSQTINIYNEIILQASPEGNRDLWMNFWSRKLKFDFVYKIASKYGPINSIIEV